MSRGRSTYAGVAWSPVSTGRHVRRHGDELRDLLGGRRGRRAVPVRRVGQRAQGPAARAGRVRLARLSSGRRAGPALRLPRVRPVRPVPRPALQPAQTATGPVRAGGRRRHRLAPVAVCVRLRQSGRNVRPRLRGAHGQGRRRQPVLRLGQRPAPGHPVPPFGDLRGPCQRAHRTPPRRAEGHARHVLRDRPPGDHRAPQGPRRDRGRAHAGAPVRARQPAGRPGAAQLLGLQHAGLLRAVPRLLGDGLARPADPGVPRHGQGPARRGHGGHPRRGLQPHGGGQPPRPDDEPQGHRQPDLLPVGGRSAQLLHGLHRYG